MPTLNAERFAVVDGGVAPAISELGNKRIPGSSAFANAMAEPLLKSPDPNNRIPRKLRGAPQAGFARNRATGRVARPAIGVAT